MTKSILLGAGKVLDTEVKTVELYQIVQYEGPGCSQSRYVVYDITHDRWGYSYHLINVDTHEFLQSEHIRPLSEKFGIGIYYNDTEPEFLTAEEVAALKAKADERKAAEEQVQRDERAEHNRIAAIGADKLRKVMPADAKAIIVAHLHENDSDPYTDYHGCHTVRTVILGFSTHTRDIFSEMRRAAANFDETAHLAEPNPGYEHREKYSMGHGYYLGGSYYSGWIIEKEPFAGIEGLVKQYAYTAGCEGGLQLKAPRTASTDTANAAPVEGVRVEIVDYSEKAIAVFGDTEPIKEILGGLFGRFNRRLTRGTEKCAGWIFPKTREQRVRETLTPYLTE